MSYIDTQLITFKRKIEEAILTGGVNGKQSIIRSSELINLIHDAVKNEFIIKGVNPENIFPPFNETKPELKMAGFLKQKDQDICVVPSVLQMQPTIINWGPLAFENKKDPYGANYSENTLVVNVRSQMSSLEKNSDTLFERTVAEALNLHMKYPKIVLGEVYLIPVYEYNDEMVKNHKVGFKNRQTNIEKYISFFNSINGRKIGEDDYAYERCALLIVDFSEDIPHLFKDSYELKKAGLISSNFNIEYASLNFHDFAEDILNVYAERFDLSNILL